jgi:hypothetical protein
VVKQVALLFLGCAFLVQAQQPRSFVGTVAGFRPENAQFEIRPDTGGPILCDATANTMVRRIAPGARDLKDAQVIKITDVSIGDRVLVALEPGTRAMLRIVVMPAQDISQHNEADRRDWEQHGVSGIVASKSGNRITVKVRTAAGESEALVTVDDKTAFRRYAPDSVKFADAKTSGIAEVSPGDQLRARGEKSDDGLKVSAREVVFGTFLVKAGTVVSVNPDSREITVKELGTNKPLTIALTADSQMKQMPSFPAAMGTPGRGGPPMPGGPPAGGPPGAGGPGGHFDIYQMLEHMPAATLADLKPGSTLVVSSTKGANANHLTAIMVLANADMLIQMASAMSGNGRGGRDSGVGGLGPGVMMGGDLGALGLGGMIVQ